MEALFGPGAAGPSARTPLIHAEWARELNHKAVTWVAAQQPLDTARSLTICIGTTDVHEHGKYLVEQALQRMGVTIADAGIAVDPEALVARAAETGADAIAISTYNGVALRYAQAVKTALATRGLAVPVLIGGRLNEVPDESNSGLPVDVTRDIANLGCLPCADLDEMLSAIRAIQPAA